MLLAANEFFISVRLLGLLSGNRRREFRRYSLLTKSFLSCLQRGAAVLLPPPLFYNRTKKQTSLLKMFLSICPSIGFIRSLKSFSHIRY